MIIYANFDAIFIFCLFFWWHAHTNCYVTPYRYIRFRRNGIKMCVSHDTTIQNSKRLRRNLRKCRGGASPAPPPPQYSKVRGPLFPYQTLLKYHIFQFAWLIWSWYIYDIEYVFSFNWILFMLWMFIVSKLQKSNQMNIAFQVWLVRHIPGYDNFVQYVYLTCCPLEPGGHFNIGPWEFENSANNGLRPHVNFTQDTKLVLHK